MKNEKKVKARKPMFNMDDEVKFKIVKDDEEVELKGFIYIVNTYRAGENSSIYYDVMVKAEDNPFADQDTIYKKDENELKICW